MMKDKKDRGEGLSVVALQTDCGMLGMCIYCVNEGIRLFRGFA